MPRLIRETNVQISWTDILARGSAATPPHKVIVSRTPGTHLSGILRYIAISSKLLKGIDPVTGKWEGDADSDLLEEDMPLRMCMGMAFEEWIAVLYPDMLWQPGELFQDGVIGSPDGLTVDDEHGPIIEEFKCTWKSSRQGIMDPKHTLWHWQGEGYAYMYGTQLVRYNIFWVNGNYDRAKGAGGPQYTRYLVEYSPAELKNIWKMILMNRNAPGVKVEG